MNTRLASLRSRRLHRPMGPSELQAWAPGRLPSWELMGTFGRNTGVRKLVRRSRVHFPFVRLYAAVHVGKYKWESNFESLYSPLTWTPPQCEGERRGACSANRPDSTLEPDYNTHRRLHESHVHSCRETSAHTPSTRGPANFPVSGDVPVSPRVTRKDPITAASPSTSAFLALATS